MGSRSTYDIQGEYARLYDLLDHGPDEDGTSEIIDAFDALTGESEDKLTSCGMVLLRWESERDGLQREIDRLATRKQAIERNESRLRQRVREFMIDISLHKVKVPAVTVSLAKATQRVDVVDPNRIPSAYMVKPPAPPPRPDKKLIATVLKSGEKVPGAVLVDSQRRLTIK